MQRIYGFQRKIVLNLILRKKITPQKFRDIQVAFLHLRTSVSGVIDFLAPVHRDCSSLLLLLQLCCMLAQESHLKESSLDDCSFRLTEVHEIAPIIWKSALKAMSSLTPISV